MGHKFRTGYQLWKRSLGLRGGGGVLSGVTLLPCSFLCLVLISAPLQRCQESGRLPENCMICVWIAAQISMPPWFLDWLLPLNCTHLIETSPILKPILPECILKWLASLPLFSTSTLMVTVYNLLVSTGMLLRFFVNLYNLEVIEEEAFIKWKEDITDEFPGKGQALFQVCITYMHKNILTGPCIGTVTNRDHTIQGCIFLPTSIFFIFFIITKHCHPWGRGWPPTFGGGGGGGGNTCWQKMHFCIVWSLYIWIRYI